MKKKISTPAKVGLFGVTMAVLLYLGINFIRSKKIFSSDNVYYAEYSQADGIEVSSPVLIKGFKVGTVDKITFDIENSTVVVKMSIDNEYPIPNDSKAKITSTGLLGSQVVEIVLGRSSMPLEDGARIESTRSQGLMDIAGDEYEKLKLQASSLVDNLTKVMEGVNAVLSSDNVANLSRTLANLESMSNNLDGAIANQRKSLEGLLSNLNKVSTRLNENVMPKLDNTLGNVETLSNSLATDAPTLISNASKAVDNLNGVLAKINNSEGTLGKMVNDEEVYTNLADATNALTLLLEDLKANPKRYVNISVFGGKKDKKK